MHTTLLNTTTGKARQFSRRGVLASTLVNLPANSEIVATLNASTTVRVAAEHGTVTVRATEDRSRQYRLDRDDRRSLDTFLRDAVAAFRVPNPIEEIPR
jgi:hypothetical protein